MNTPFHGSDNHAAEDIITIDSINTFVLNTYTWTLGICVSLVGEDISLGICVSQVEEHISLGICVSQVGKHISQGIYLSQVREHI